MNPVIAIVGRPNVGKSTLFNCLTRTRSALVADVAGLTRDRLYGNGEIDQQPFTVIDTGGINGDETELSSAITEQALLAIDEADIVLFVVDGHAGLTPLDHEISRHLRVNNKKTWLVVNKTDGLNIETALLDFYALGFGNPIAIAAAHNYNIRHLMTIVLADIQPQPTTLIPQIDHDVIRICVVGRPNVGKSTLINRLLGEERVVVFDEAGTTRDAIAINYEHQGQHYTLIDTAGIRRRKHITDKVEKFSIVKTLEAIQNSHVAILVLDARQSLVEQDLHLLDYIISSGRAFVIAINKWDGLTHEIKQRMRNDLNRRLGFADYAEILFISALHGTNVGLLYPALQQAFNSAFARWPTRRLTEILHDAQQQHAPPLVHNRRIKLKLAHQGGQNPPLIIVHGNQVDALPQAYQRYLMNKFRQVLKIKGTPLRFEFRSGQNPFNDQTHNDRIKARERQLARTRAARQQRRS